MSYLHSYISNCENKHSEVQTTEEIKVNRNQTQPESSNPTFKVLLIWNR